MKLASVIAILTFAALPGLQATPIDLTATNIFFDCVGRVPCGSYEISGPGFQGDMDGNVLATTSPGGTMELQFLGGRTLTVGNTTYGNATDEPSMITNGPVVIAEMTTTTLNPDGEWSASGPATATGEITVCFISALPSGDYICDPGLAFAIINLPGLSGTFYESWYDVAGNPFGPVIDVRSGSLSATITPEPLSAGIAFAGLLFLVAYCKCQSKHLRALRDRFTVEARV
jgi:hypothetical protein